MSGTARPSWKNTMAPDLRPSMLGSHISKTAERARKNGYLYFCFNGWIHDSTSVRCTAWREADLPDVAAAALAPADDAPDQMSITEVNERIVRHAKMLWQAIHEPYGGVAASHYQAAERQERELYRDVLRAIAAGACAGHPPEDIAAECLKLIDSRHRRA